MAAEWCARRPQVIALGCRRQMPIGCRGMPGAAAKRLHAMPQHLFGRRMDVEPAVLDEGPASGQLAPSAQDVLQHGIHLRQALPALELFFHVLKRHPAIRVELMTEQAAHFSVKRNIDEASFAGWPRRPVKTQM